MTEHNKRKQRRGTEQETGSESSRESLAYALDLQSPAAGEDFQRVRSMCVEVLERMPLDARDALLDPEMLVLWCPADLSWTDSRYAPPESELWFVILSASLPALDELVGKGIVAHEFAHAFCRHDAGGDERESEADAVARAWGFEREIDELNKRFPR